MKHKVAFFIIIIASISYFIVYIIYKLKKRYDKKALLSWQKKFLKNKLTERQKEILYGFVENKLEKMVLDSTESAVVELESYKILIKAPIQMGVVTRVGNVNSTYILQPWAYIYISKLNKKANKRNCEQGN